MFLGDDHCWSVVTNSRPSVSDDVPLVKCNFCFHLLARAVGSNCRRCVNSACKVRTSLKFCQAVNRKRVRLMEWLPMCRKASMEEGEEPRKVVKGSVESRLKMRRGRDSVLEGFKVVPSSKGMEWEEMWSPGMCWTGTTEAGSEAEVKVKQRRVRRALLWNIWHIARYSSCV